MRYTSRIILDNKLSLLQKELYTVLLPIDTWQTKELLYTKPLEYEAIDAEWSTIRLGEHWKSTYDHTRLFKADVTLPAILDGAKAYLVLKIGGEGLVRINGEIISALTSYVGRNYTADEVRSRVVIPTKYKAGDVLHIEIETCMNFLEATYTVGCEPCDTFAEYTMETAFIGTCDSVLESYYYDLRNAVEAMDTFANPLDTFQESNAQIRNGTVQQIMNSLNHDSALQKKLLRVITDSLNALEFEMGRDALLSGIPNAASILKEGLAALPEKVCGMVKFVGQAHIDTAWLWPFKESVRKCAKTFSNVIALIDEYPEMIFAFSQPQLFLYTEEFYPDLFKKVTERVKDGHIELVGNAWVEMDTNVPSGESLVRQLLYGREYFLRRFGKESRVFWMPDVFGYSYALPQIMKRSGVDYFYTSKLCNNDTNHFPHSLFRWQGVDGTQILSYLQRLNYNGMLNAGTLHEIYSLYDQKDMCDTALMTIGYGDGGGGPSYQMMENSRRLKNFPGLPESEFATSESFFEDAEKVEDNLPVWNDEMYYEFHRGTYTSQANNKKNNRKGELLLRRTEILQSLKQIYCGSNYPAEEIGEIWKPLLTCQFHDVLPGSSIHQVYADCASIYADIFKKANALSKDALDALNKKIGVKANQIIVWNLLSWNRNGTISVTIPGKYAILKDDTGNIIPSSVSYDDNKTTFVFFAQDIPAMGYSIFTAEDAAERICDSPLWADKLHLENAHLCVTLDHGGNIISLYDKHARREVFEKGSRNNLLTIFEDIPHRESAWNIDMEYEDKPYVLDQAESVVLAEYTPVRAVIRMVHRFHLSTITQDIILTCDSRRVEFATHVDWNETQHMLKAAFTPDVLSSKATYEIQFGAIERPTHRNTSYDTARFEVCGHKWADISEGKYGFSLLNDCKYGYDTHGNVMRLTLLRSPNYPDLVGDKGVHDFTYAIYPHEGDWRTALTVREAYDLNEPLFACIGTSDIDPEAVQTNASFVETDQDNVVIDSIKGAQDGNGLILRVYESQGARCGVMLCFEKAPVSVQECNLMEVDEKPVETNGSGFSFYIKPYEIKTFRVNF